MQLNLTKPGSAPAAPLKLNLTKGAIFKAELFWDSPEDLDVHALLARNDGTKARISDGGQILSPYNLQSGGGTLKLNPDRTFSTPCGALTHSGDARDGTKNSGVDESLTIDTSRLGPETNEIPIVITIHSDKKPGLTFAHVKAAGIRLKDNAGKVLGEYQLSNEFGEFGGVQMGALILSASGQWEYHPVGVGFHGDFNTVLNHFAS